MKKAIGLGAIFLMIASTAAFAGQNPEAKVAIHVEAHVSRTCTKNFPTIASPDDIVYTDAGTDMDAFPVFFDMVEYQGFDYGMTWPGTYSCAFTSCSDLTIGTIQYPDDGISHAWYACQASGIAVVGWGWISEPAAARICIVNHPVAAGIIAGDCSGVKDTIYVDEEHVFCAGIAGGTGDKPQSPTEATSWGKIKAIFK